MTNNCELETAIISRIKSSEESVFMRSDFENIDGYEYNKVGRILKKLIEEDKLIRISHGIYARTEISIVTGNIIPDKCLPDLAVEVVNKFYGMKTYPTRADVAYRDRKSTQVPTGRAIGVKKPISRKISRNGARIYFHPAAEG